MPIKINEEVVRQITGLSNGDGTFTMKFESVELDDEPKISKRAEILHEAEHCICGQREQDYGSPEDNFSIIAKMWSAYTETKITALDVSMMMCLLKIARIKNGGGTGDSFVDIAGYAACGGEIYDRKCIPENVPKFFFSTSRTWTSPMQKKNLGTFSGMLLAWLNRLDGVLMKL